jgi:membrane protease YdiL (CAAX protease family)
MPALRSNRLPAFFALTFLWSWVFFALVVPRLRAGWPGEVPPWVYLALLVGAYGPSLAAVALTARDGGWEAVRALLAGFLAWRGRWAWHLAALLLTTALGLVALLLWASFGGGELSLALYRARWIPVAILAAVPFGPLAEEIGWRGYAQPRLLERCGPLATGAILGTAWTAWHIPLFFAPIGASISGEPITVASVAFYWSLLVGISIVTVALSLRTGTHLLTGFLVHLGFNVELYRFFFDLPEQRGAIERWALVPLWALVLWLLATGRLAGGRSESEEGDSAP